MSKLFSLHFQNGGTMLKVKKTEGEYGVTVLNQRTHKEGFLLSETNIHVTKETLRQLGLWLLHEAKTIKDDNINYSPFSSFGIFEDEQEFTFNEENILVPKINNEYGTDKEVGNDTSED